MSSPQSNHREVSSEALRQGSRSRRKNAAADERPEPQKASAAGDRAVPEPPEESPDTAQAESLFSWTFRDFLIPYILLALSLQRAHGYFIEQYLRSLGLANVEMSTLYRTLRQMEKDGLVCSTWEPGPEGPARRIYSLTDVGRWWLYAGAAVLSGYRALIDRFFGTYSGPSHRPEDDDKKGASS